MVAAVRTRFDVVMLGIDPERSRAEVVTAVAARLEVTEGEVELAIARAPRALVRARTEDDARRLVDDLRALGVRVKPREQAIDLDDAQGEPFAEIEQKPQPFEAAETVEAPAPRISSAVHDDDVPVYRMSSPAPIDDDQPVYQIRTPAPIDEAPTQELAAPDSTSTEPIGSPLRLPPSEGSALSPPDPPTPTLPQTSPSAPAPRTLVDALRAQPSAPAPAPRLAPRRPRALWPNLPNALVLPFRGGALHGTLGAPLVAAIAMLTLVVGLRADALRWTAPALAVTAALTVVFLGLALQVARRCLVAAALGQSSTDDIPTHPMDDVVLPGFGVLVAQGLVGGATTWLTTLLRAQHATPLLLGLVWAAMALFSVVGLTLSAAHGSAVGYLDVGRMARLARGAPLAMATLAVIGAAVLGLAAVGGLLVVDVATATRNALKFVTVAGAGGLAVTFVATYGMAATASVLGTLFWARPSIARD
jgi:hypothetical protein